MNDEHYDDEDEDPLADVRRRFALSLEVWREEAVSFRSLNDREALRSHCHRIKGTAGMLGCSDLSSAGAVCESILTEECAEGEFDQALEALFRCIDSVVAEHVPKAT